MTLYFGVDVSHWDDGAEFPNTFPPDFPVSFVIIKGGEGKVIPSREGDYMYIDTAAQEHIEQCKRLKIPWGTYVYWRASKSVSPYEQLKALYDEYYPHGCRLFALDFEEIYNSKLIIQDGSRVIGAIDSMQNEFSDSLFLLYTNPSIYNETILPAVRKNQEYWDGRIKLWLAQYPYRNWNPKHALDVISGKLSTMTYVSYTQIVMWQFTAYIPPKVLGIKSNKMAMDGNVIVDPTIYEYLAKSIRQSPSTSSEPSPVNGSETSVGVKVDELAKEIKDVENDIVAIKASLDDVVAKLESMRSALNAQPN